MPSDIATYLQAVLQCLEASPNLFFRRHPEILERLREPETFEQCRRDLAREFIRVYETADLDFAAGLIAFDLDDADFDRVSLSFAATHEYEEWMEFDESDFEVDLDGLIAALFAGVPDWSAGARNELKHFQNLMIGLVELAALDALTDDAFRKLRAPDRCILLSSVWHDVEKSAFYDSSAEVPLRGTIDDPPVPTSERPQIPGPAVARDARFFRGEGAGSGRLPEGIEVLTELEELEYSNEYLSEFPDVLFGLTGLTKLDLEKNEIERIGAGIAALDRLKILNLRENRLRSLPEQIGALRKLERLSAEYNALSSLPANIAQLEALEELSLYNNRLERLPELPPALTWLNLNENRLAELPESFRGLRRLETLVLSANRFAEVPPQLFELPRLRSLELGANPIDDLPDALLELPALEELRVYPNRFSIKQRARLREKFGARLFVGYDSDPKSFWSDS